MRVNVTCVLEMSVAVWFDHIWVHAFPSNYVWLCPWRLEVLTVPIHPLGVEIKCQHLGYLPVVCRPCLFPCDSAGGYLSPTLVLLPLLSPPEEARWRVLCLQTMPHPRTPTSTTAFLQPSVRQCRICLSSCSHCLGVWSRLNYCLSVCLMWYLWHICHTLFLFWFCMRVPMLVRVYATVCVSFLGASLFTRCEELECTRLLAGKSGHVGLVPFVD